VVRVLGEWDNWREPGIEGRVRDDGWVRFAIDAPAGDYAYIIEEDGVRTLDAYAARSTFYRGEEVSLGRVDDCDAPLVQVNSTSATPQGTVTVDLKYAPARSLAPIDPEAIDAISTDGVRLSVASVDTGEGLIRMQAAGLKEGKYTFSVRAKDAAGAEAPTVMATVWVEPRPWDPRDALVYHVMIDRFRADSPSGPKALASPALPSQRAGGTLAGVRQAIESGEITALGANTIWLSPLYLNPDGEFKGLDNRNYSSYHGYWPIASRELDGRLTDAEELRRFMTAAHERGIRVLFDVVPNHVHEQHPWSKEHPSWLKLGCVCGRDACDWGRNIQTCSFAPYMPDVDWKNPAAARAMTADVMWWLDTWSGDGIRIDAVPMMPRAAISQMAYEARARYEHPGNHVYVLGEHFTGPGAYNTLSGDLGPFGLDGSFHFPLMWTLRSVIAKEREPMSAIAESFAKGEQAWSKAEPVMGLMIGNHDVSRFASVSAGTDGGDAWEPAAAPLSLMPDVHAKQRLALGTVLTLPGAPVIYYGDEVALEGKGDPDCRRVMPAEQALSALALKTRELTRRLGRVRACSEALRRGTTRTLFSDAERFVFVREVRSKPEQTVVVALTRRPSGPFAVELAEGLPTEWRDAAADPGEGAASRSSAPSSAPSPSNAAFDPKPVSSTPPTNARLLRVPGDAFGVHVYVDAAGPCAALPQTR